MSAAPAILYRIAHRTEYRYASPVSLSQQLLHLAPRNVPRQECIEHALTLSPTPSRRLDSHDAFGNPLTRLDFERPHDRLAIVSTSLVRIAPRAAQISLTDSPPWEDVLAATAYRAARPTEHTLDAARFRSQSPYVRVKPVLADYARDVFVARRPLLDAAHALMLRIHSEFTYDQDATQIATPLMDVFANKRGVCQDFAHLMLACLRSLGLSARYVSGYLRSARDSVRADALVGSDASHAWVSVFCPMQGWVDFDPTNRVIPDTSHVTLAWGRDFGDVSPLRGVILGGGAHTLKVGVAVVPGTALATA